MAKLIGVKVVLEYDTCADVILDINSDTQEFTDNDLSLKEANEMAYGYMSGAHHASVQPTGHKSFDFSIRYKHIEQNEKFEEWKKNFILVQVGQSDPSAVAVEADQSTCLLPDFNGKPCKLARNHEGILHDGR